MGPFARRVVCTGIGVVSPLGIGARKSWEALVNLKNGLSELKPEHSFEGGRSRVAAHVPEDELKEQVSQAHHSYLVKNAKQLSRATLMAMLASHEALEDAQLLDTQHQLLKDYRCECGVAIGQGMVDFQDIYINANHIVGEAKKSSDYRKMSPFFMTRALMNMSAGNVSIRYKIHGPNHCVSTACATGAHSIGDAFNFIKYHKVNLMVCGSSEASINSTAMAGFERLKALCYKYNDNPRESSRPFDMDRCGFVMGEGAGVLILEELEHAKARGLEDNQIYAEILGYGLSSDAHHLTAPLPDGGGAKLSMISALRDAQLTNSDVGYVNAHATSTPLGDDIEANAIEDLFFSEQEKNNRNLPVSSLKGAIGHLLGAAGSVETIFGLLSCRDGIILPTLNLKHPLKTRRNLLDLTRDGTKKWEGDRRVLIKNSFGFGGTNASLVIVNYNSSLQTDKKFI